MLSDKLSMKRRRGGADTGRRYYVSGILVFSLVCLFLTAAASLPAVSRAELIDRVAAFVNDRAITLSEVRETYERTRKAQPDISMKEVLTTMINRLLILNDARRAKIEGKTEEEILNEYTEFKVRAFIRVREEDVEEYYRRNEKELGGADYESVRDKIEEYLTEKEVNRLLKKQIDELRKHAYIKIVMQELQ